MTEDDLRRYLEFLNKADHFEEWFLIVKNILLDKEFQKRIFFKHHHNSVFYHSVLVSYYAFNFAYNKKCDKRVCAIAGLLHDFYPYPWQYSKELKNLDPILLEHLQTKKKFFQKHGFVHAKEALENVQKFFHDLESKKIDDAILRHMFPLNIALPKYKESWIITYSDKMVTMKELLKNDRH